MQHKIVGIVPSAQLFQTEDIYQDCYRFVNNYMVRIAKHGGTPIGLLSVDGRLCEDALELTDAILIAGGTKIHPYHFQAVHHAVQTGKPLLGICLGMQVIHAYFVVADEAMRRGFCGDLLELYDSMKKERHMFVLPVEHHWDVHITRGHEEDAKHTIAVRPGTLLHSLMGTDAIRGASMHNYRVNAPSPRLTVSAVTPDGTIEALEAGPNILGVQFHPEVDDQLAPLFRFLTR